VIFLTGRAEKGDIVNGLDAGANDCAARPYDNEELQARLQVGRRMLELQAHPLAARDALAQQAKADGRNRVAYAPVRAAAGTGTPTARFA
jgi:DNA-binding response OmpR family regulator